MSSTLISQKCPVKNPHEPRKELKKVAKYLPAYEAYRGIITRTLGIHHWLANNYRDAVISLIVTLGIISAIIVANIPGILDKNHEHFCCYPADAPRGILGSCTDSSSAVQNHPDKQTCTTNGPQYWILTVFYILAIAGLYYFSDESKIRFFEACDRQWQELKKEIVNTPLTSSDPEERYKTQKGTIVKWQDSHPGILLLMFMPESFLFGLHYRTFGKNTIYYIYNLTFWLGTLFAILFFTAALPLDKAWKCYPTSSLQDNDLGRCDNPKSIAAQSLPVKNLKHTTFFWVAVGSWSIGHSVSIGLFLYSTIFFRELYASHVSKMLKSYTVAMQVNV
jgi:hypothetical protein